jgi:hypothetical protein
MSIKTGYNDGGYSKVGILNNLDVIASQLRGIANVQREIMLGLEK